MTADLDSAGDEIPPRCQLLEVFLYDWWPIREEARLHDRLTAMVVRINYSSARHRTPGVTTG